MTLRTRFLAVVAVWGIVILGLLTLPLVWRDRLPEQLVRHWDLNGNPDGMVGTDAFLIGAVVVWCAVLLLALGVVAHGAVLRRRASRTQLAGLLGASGALVVGAMALTVAANFDVAEAAAAQVPWWAVVLLPVVVLIAGWAGGVVGRSGPDELPDGDVVPAMRLQPGQRAVWVSTGRNGWLMLLGCGLLIGGVVALWLGHWRPLTGVTVAAAGVLVALFSSVSVRVADSGVRVRLSPLRVPFRSVPLAKVAGARVERRSAYQHGGLGYRGIPGNATLLVRGGDCLVLRYASGGELGISVDDAERGAALLNALVTGPETAAST